jgi:NADH-quinone oxidoreductase subunit A
MLTLAYYQEYKILLFSMLLCFCISTLLVTLTYFLSPDNPDKEKLSSYECGFEPFQDARVKFDVHFYLVAILFIIFDLEIVFLFPWAYFAGSLSNINILTIIFFLFILFIGFVYEWKREALVWK